MSLKVLILGVNGFIGSHLLESILTNTDWQIAGFDLSDHHIKHHIGHAQFSFKQGDIRKETDWLEAQLKACDVLLPLIAIATPATYVKEPLRIFELDFEENLKIIRLANQHHTRVIFPSTSEVYGMSDDIPFEEETSALTYGPIKKERWIYACSKQLLDRIIFAMGIHQNLQYSIFRPFNWFGPRLDDPTNDKKGGSRALTQFIGNIIRGEDIQLVDGGTQKRCFTYIEDGISALMKIIENKNGCADNGIFNIGTPDENHTIKTLAQMLIKEVSQFPKYKTQAEQTQLIEIDAADYYGKGYQDVSLRVPSIEAAKSKLNWQPTVDLRSGIQKTLAYYLS